MVNNIGIALRGGKSVFGPRNESLALHFFFFAATKGHIGAAVNLANSYAAADADGVARSLSKALEWYKYAASKNHQGDGDQLMCRHYLYINHMYFHFLMLGSLYNCGYILLQGSSAGDGNVDIPVDPVGSLEYFHRAYLIGSPESEHFDPAYAKATT